MWRRAWPGSSVVEGMAKEQGVVQDVRESLTRERGVVEGVVQGVVKLHKCGQGVAKRHSWVCILSPTEGWL